MILYSHRNFHQQYFRIAICFDRNFISVPDPKTITGIELLPINRNIAVQYKCIYAVPFFPDHIFCRKTFIQFSKMEPCVLMYPNTCSVCIWREYFLQLVMPVFCIQSYLTVPWLNIFFVRENPYLQKLYQFVFILIILAMKNSRACAHRLNVAFFNDSYIAHAVFMLQIAF